MKLTIDVDARGLIAALDQLGAAVEAHVLEAARVTAENIKREALARVARRTGKTAAGIKAETAAIGVGYVVFVDRPELQALPGWLEWGTKYMTARPFLFSSARLEEGAHDRRMRQAIQDAIDEASR